MNSFFHLLSGVTEKLKPAIDQLGLSVREDKSDTVSLYNQNCIFILNNVDNRYIGFKIVNALDSEAKGYLLTGYLDTIEDGLATKLLPLPGSNWSESERFDYYLESYCKILLAHLSAPLAGDFNWINEYHRLEQEKIDLEDLIMDQIKKGNPRGREVFKLLTNGTPGWKEEARALKNQ